LDHLVPKSAVDPFRFGIATGRSFHMNWTREASDASDGTLEAR